MSLPLFYPCSLSIHRCVQRIFGNVVEVSFFDCYKVQCKFWIHQSCVA